MFRLYTLVYVQNEGKTLMLFRNKKENDLHEGKWNGLGGKIEIDETPEECAIREVEEESGLLIKSPKLAGILTCPNFYGDGSNTIIFVFKSNSFSGNQIDSAEGKLEWIQHEKVLELNLWEADKIFIPWVFENKFFSAKLNYENKKLVSQSVNFY